MMGRKHIVSKKTIYKGVMYDSKLEVFMCQMLEAKGIAFKYEGESFTLLEEFEYPAMHLEKAQKKSDKMSDRRKVRGMIYTPDFIDPEQKWIIECKGRANESFPLRWKFFKSIMRKRIPAPQLFKPSTKNDCLQVAEILVELGYGGKSYRKSK